MSCLLRGETPYTWYCGLLLMLCYAVGEVGHFLLGVTSKPMAQSIHFGEQQCMPKNESFNSYLDTCHEAIKNETKCILQTSNGTNVCKWDYSGSGVEYQLLAGPLFVAIFTIMGIVLGVLGDTYNRVRILFVCVFICSLMIVLTGFSTQFWQLALLRLGFGAAEAGFSPLSAGIIADTFGSASRGLGMSVFNWGIYFGFGSAFAIGNLVTAANIMGQGWRWSYFISGMPGFLFGVAMLFTVREPPRKNIIAETEVAATEVEREKYYSQEGPKLHPSIMKIWNSIKFFITRPPLLALLLAACIRHSASFCFAYNAQLYFNHFYPETNLGLWMTLSSIIGGSIGIAMGGLMSDLVVSRYGVSMRLWVLVASQAMAAPLAMGVLYTQPPYCFLFLISAYLFAEMWFGILFAALVELLPVQVRSTSLAMFFFVINNIAGGTLLCVPKIKSGLGVRQAMTLVYPGFYLISSFVFLTAQLLLKRELRRKKRNASVLQIDEQEDESSKMM